MTDSNSPIHDFYPTDFRVDLEGKRNDWEGVVLIPFIDEARLLAASHTVGPAKLSRVRYAATLLHCVDTTRSHALFIVILLPVLIASWRAQMQSAHSSLICSGQVFTTASGRASTLASVKHLHQSNPATSFT